MEDGFIIWGEDGECHPLSFAEAPSKKVAAINQSVGINGVNQATDVQTIQQALNDVPANQAQPVPLLVVDGICGSKTKSAIQKFQLAHFGWSGADGRADPNRRTIAKLNQLNTDDEAVAFAASKGNLPEPDPIVGAARVARIRGLIGMAQTCIRAAQHDSMMALPLVDSPVGSGGMLPQMKRESRMRLLNKHFEIDLLPKNEQRLAVEKISHTFSTMESVFTRPGGLWGAAIFDYDPHDKPGYAYTFPQGYYHQGRMAHTLKGDIRYDAIYFCKMIDKATDEMVALGIVHELSHFVAFPERIGDFAYGWRDKPEMIKLPPRQKIFNGMSHGNYAFEAQYGRRPAGY